MMLAFTIPALTPRSDLEPVQHPVDTAVPCGLIRSVSTGPPRRKLRMAGLKKEANEFRTRAGEIERHRMESGEKQQ